MRHASDQRGAAAVEFALLVPFLCLLLFGVVDFGYMLNRDTMINNAAREGVRTASVGGSSAEVIQTVKNFLPAMPGKLTVTVTCTKPAGTACTSYDTGAESGGTAIVKVTYLHRWITPVGSMFGGDTIGLVKTSRMRIE